LDEDGNIIANYLDNTSGHYFPSDLGAWDNAYNQFGIPAFIAAGVLGAEAFLF
jgi:hypothetical protein